MHKYLGKSSQAFKHLGEYYDKVHFVTHYSWGSIEINLFPQKREVNRGWSIEGKKYRAMEKFVAANPGTFIFSTPVYKDFNCCPYEIELGLWCEFNFVVDVFLNRLSKIYSLLGCRNSRTDEKLIGGIKIRK